jgi:UDP-N-acetylglucosamine 2-epimerase (non-hydrolysing)
MKVMSVIGTRPEAIKMAPVVLTARATPGVESVVVNTGQHREMVDDVLPFFGIRVDYDLGIMTAAQSPADVAGAIFAKLTPVIERERPDWTLVQGDTTTVLAASLVAFWSRVRVAHVEAGLRTGDKSQPFPEELNRRLASVAADLHFAPTESAKRNLLRENIQSSLIHVTGNTVIDALHWAVERVDDAVGPRSGGRLLLVTAHRRENWGAPLEDICRALADLAAAYPTDLRIVYPVHLNPRVSDTVHRMLGGISNIELPRPLGYPHFVALLKQATVVLTDSGGIQEEAPGLGIPVLVLRNTTERPEAVEAGTVRLVGTDRARIVGAVRELLDDAGAYARMSSAVNPYGDGHAAERILRALRDHQT